MRKIKNRENPDSSIKHLSKLVIDDGIRIDDQTIKGVRSYSLKQKDGENIAELTLFMDVRII